MKKISILILLAGTLLCGCGVPDTKTESIEVVLNSTQNGPYIRTDEIRKFIVTVDNYEGAERGSVLLHALTSMTPGETVVLKKDTWASGTGSTIRMYPFGKKITRADQMLSLESDGYHARVWNKIQYQYVTSFSEVIETTQAEKIVLLVFMALIMIIGGVLFSLRKDRRVGVTIIILYLLSVYTLLTFTSAFLLAIIFGFFLSLPMYFFCKKFIRFVTAILLA